MTSAEKAIRPLVCFAMREELQPFRRASEVAGWAWHGGSGAWTMRRGDDTYDVVLTGPGRLGVEETLSDRNPAFVINPGFAGSIHESLGPGDLAVVATARWGPEVLEAGPQPLPIPDIPRARIVTAPLPMGVREKKMMHADDAGELVDMETYHVLAFCRDRGIPYLGVRGVSDGLEEELPPTLVESYDGRRFRLGRIVFASIFQRETRRRLLELRRRSAEVATALAELVVAAI